MTFPSKDAWFSSHSFLWLNVITEKSRFFHFQVNLQGYPGRKSYYLLLFTYSISQEKLKVFLWAKKLVIDKWRANEQKNREMGSSRPPEQPQRASSDRAAGLGSPGPRCACVHVCWVAVWMKGDAHCAASLLPHGCCARVVSKKRLLMICWEIKTSGKSFLRIRHVESSFS